eukprot:2634658-Pyramimonas_sp.AAC.1
MQGTRHRGIRRMSRRRRRRTTTRIRGRNTVEGWMDDQVRGRKGEEDEEAAAERTCRRRRRRRLHLVALVEVVAV